MAKAPGERGRRVRRRWWIAGGLAVVVLAGTIAALIANGVNSETSSAGTASPAVACNVTKVADDVLPSVVTISARSSAGGGSGSGEVIRSEGYIVTNNHVISVAANGGSLDVLFTDGRSEPATLVGRDPLTDLAVLKVQPGPGLKVIALGSSESVRVGQPAVALGSPLGLAGTVTAGIVSALDRTVQVPGENDRSAVLVSAVQTDAAINPGNSGGALVNCDGQLIGVPTAGATVPSPSGEPSGGGSIGLGFAIPVDLASQVANEIISTGRVTHAYFGLQTVPIPAAEAARAGVPEGLYVLALAPGGPAARAGLASGDVITSIDGQPARSNIQLETLTVTKRAGDVVAVEYNRGGQSGRADITLGAQP